MIEVENYVKELLRRQLICADINVVDARDTLIASRQKAHQADTNLSLALRKQRDLKLYIAEHFPKPE